jgi:hypothetical protein
VALLALVSAAYFQLHPSDWQFWRRAVAEARKTRIGEEVRAWWGRIVVESPEAPAPPSPPVAAASIAPAAVVAATPAPGASAEASPVPSGEGAASDFASPVPATAASPDFVSLPEDEPDPPPLPAPPSIAKKDKARGPAPVDGKAPPQLAIEFEHHLKHGKLQVWVDDVRVVNDDFDGRVTRKILLFELRKGLVQQRLALAPGRHSVRVTVRWDDNTKTARTSGVFRPGVSRKLDVQVSRIGGKLSLAWK